jgi:hypothetical protein
MVESIRQQQVNGSTCVRSATRFLITALLGLTGCVSSGCVTLSGQQSSKEATPGSDIPCQVSVRWHNDVVQAPDPVHSGQPTPGLVGRVYLFNNAMLPVDGEGSLHVELADASVKPPKVLERWNLPPEAVQKLKRKDIVGTGYSLFLPWATYRPDLTTIQMRVAYQPKNGPPLYSTPSKVTLGPATTQVVSHRTQLSPRPQAQLATVPAAH